MVQAYGSRDCVGLTRSRVDDLRTAQVCAVVSQSFSGELRFDLARPGQFPVQRQESFVPQRLKWKNFISCPSQVAFKPQRSESF